MEEQPPSKGDKGAGEKTHRRKETAKKRGRKTRRLSPRVKGGIRPKTTALLLKGESGEKERAVKARGKRGCRGLQIWGVALVFPRLKTGTRRSL